VCTSEILRTQNTDSSGFYLFGGPNDPNAEV
jgi:hypothetical protein